MSALKKIELHLHIEGAAPPGFIRGIAAEKKQDLSGIFDANGAYSYTNFHDFLRVYEAATSVLTTPRDYARLLTEVLAECAGHGAIYAELFVSPEFCGGGDLAAWRDYLAAMEEAAQAAERDGITSRAILTAIRHFGPERARKTAICAAETAGGWVTGLGIGGAEDFGHLSDFAWSFDCAREAGLGLTAHAGEWAARNRCAMRCHKASPASATASAPPRIPTCCVNWPSAASRLRSVPARTWRCGRFPAGRPIPSPALPMPACA